MNTRRLGRLDVSELGDGTMSFPSAYGSSPDRSEAIRVVRGAGVTSVIAVAACAWAATASAQSLDDIQTPEEPLVLRDQGSFFVRGDSVEATATELMSFTDEPAPVAGHITVNQMYVDARNSPRARPVMPASGRLSRAARRQPATPLWQPASAFWTFGSAALPQRIHVGSSSMKRDELGDLLAFLAVCEERSFTRAAARQ